MNDKPQGIDGAATPGSFMVDDATKSMSARHMKDTLEYNLRHAEDHLKKAKEACESLTKQGVKANIPRSLVDLGDYFEQKGGYQESVDSKVSKVANKIRQ